MDDLRQYSGLEDGIYTAKPGTWVHVQGGNPAEFAAPDYDLDMILTRNPAVPYRGPIDGDRTARIPSKEEVLEYVHPDEKGPAVRNLLDRILLHIPED